MEVIEVDQLEEKKMKGWSELCHTQYYNQIRLNKIKSNILWRRMTFDGRRRLTEDLWRKTTFDGRRYLTEDDLWQKTTFDGRQHLTEDELWRKTNFDGRRPLTEDNLWWKSTFDGRQPFIGLHYITGKISTTTHLDSHSTTNPKPEFLSAV